MKTLLITSPLFRGKIKSPPTSDGPQTLAPKPRAIGSNFRFILTSIREYDVWIFPFLLINIVFAGLGTIVPLIMPKLIIDQFSLPNATQGVITYAIVFGLLLFVTAAVAEVTRSATMYRFVIWRFRLIRRSGIKFMSMDYQYLEDPKVLDLAKRGEKAYWNNNDGIEGVMHRIQSGSIKTLTIVGTGLTIYLLNPAIAVAILSLQAVNFWAANRTRSKDKTIQDAIIPITRRIDYLSKTMSDFAYAKEIRLFSMGDFLSGRYQTHLAERIACQCRIWILWARQARITAILVVLQEILLYAWLCWSVLYRDLSIGNFTMYALAIRAFSEALAGCLDDLSHIRLPANLAQGSLQFEFRNVSFHYPGQEHPVLKDFYFTITAGERLAIVGLNGAGKTTFIKLLTRLYEPDSGQILLNGKNIRDYDKKAYYQLFSTVFQEIELFAFTVAENVAMTDGPLLDREKVTAAIKQAGLTAKIEGLPTGIDQSVFKIIEDDGVDFSGGEKQKLVLARALYKNAPVVILDEPTAALDALAEERFYLEFDRLTKGKTAVYISHRLASTRFCDRVALFANGTIAEAGTHAELIARGGKYAELFSIQAKYYNAEASA